MVIIHDTGFKLKQSLSDDCHDVPFRELNKRCGPLANTDAPESKTTNLIRRIFMERGCHKTGLEAYNHILKVRIPRRITNTIMHIGDITVNFSDISIYKPIASRYRMTVPLLPVKARHDRGSYVSKIHAKISMYKNDKLISTEEAEICEVPVMMGCITCHTHNMTDGQKLQIGECPNDTFGYFIHNGVERFIKSKETLRYNIPVTYKESIGFETRFTCTASLDAPTTLFLMRYPIGGKDDNNQFIVKLQHFDDVFVDVISLFRFLGWSAEKAVETIVDFCHIPDKNKLKVEQLLRDTTAFSKNIRDDKLNDYFSTLRREKAINSDDVYNDVEHDLFPHIKSIDYKLYTLAFTTSRTAMVILGYISEDDRNSWAVKKYQIAADKIASHFFGAWSNMIRKIEESVSKAGVVTSMSHYFTSYPFSKNMADVFSTKVKRGIGRGGDKQPPSEPYKRNTPIDGASMITKSGAHTSSRNTKNEVRVINPSQVLYSCPAETPESEKIGIIKNKSITMWIASSVNSPTHDEIVEVLGEPLLTEPTLGAYPLFCNGRLLGFMKESNYQQLLTLKSSGMMRFDSHVSFNKVNQVYEIFTLESRPTVPLLVVKDGVLLIDAKDMWYEPLDDLISEGVLEYIDAREMEYLTVSESVNLGEYPHKYTHSVIQSNAMFGIAASLSPWSNKNKGPRVIYQASMVKQSQSAFALTHQVTYLSTFKVLNFATRPICESNIAKPIGLESMPNSENMLIAIMTMPNNNEDAVVVNAEALNKEFMRVTKYTGINDTSENSKVASEIYAKPIVTKRNDPYVYRNIQEDGFPSIGSYINRKDCVIGKLRSENKGDISFNHQTGDYETKTGTRPDDVSKFAGVDEDGYVDRINVSRASDGEMTLRMKILQHRMYEAGDKVALRYSQKGTVGEIKNACDMPRIHGGPYHGVIPDICFSSASLPSRMTAAMPIELSKGLSYIYDGIRVDCTTFEDDDINEPAKKLKIIGKERFGMKGKQLELFQNGMHYMERADGKIMGKWILNDDGTEEFVRSEVFIAPGAYQVLRHHVKDKFQLRKEGPINILTRQGVSGRSRQGGLRFGGMECDATSSSGSANLLVERMRIVADNYTLFICSCSAPAIANPVTKTVTCTANRAHCKNGDKHQFMEVETCYIARLIMGLLSMANIKMDIIPKISNRQ
jgi:DNA-directed RNA polymerase II subunit RPB2